MWLQCSGMGRISCSTHNSVIKAAVSSDKYTNNTAPLYISKSELSSMRNMSSIDIYVMILSSVFLSVIL